ncbi:hypothetical protein ACM9XA_03550 [Xanthomonas sacchari]
MTKRQCQPQRADWRKTNPQYRPSPTQRHADGSISQDGGTRSDQLHTLREWYRIRGVKSYA